MDQQNADLIKALEETDFLKVIGGTTSDGTDLSTEEVDSLNEAVSNDRNESIEELKKDHREGIGELAFTPAEEAAARFTYLVPALKRMLGNMPAKATARVTAAIAVFPLGDSTDINEMGLRSREEKKAFEIFFNIQECKHIITKELMEQNKTEQIAQGEQING